MKHRITDPIEDLFTGINWALCLLIAGCVLVLAFLCAGCSAAGDDFSVARDSDRWVVDYDAPEPENTDDGKLEAPLVSQTGPIMFVDTPRVMYVAPDATLAPYVQLAIDRLTALGFNIVIDPTGIPMWVDDSVPAGSQARTYLAPLCAYDGCNASNAHVKVTHALLEHEADFIRVSLEHELGHILSGLGMCAKGKGLPMASDGAHLVKGNVISNGNSGYGSFALTQADFQLMRSCL